MSQIRLPFMLSDKITGTLTIKLSVGREMSLHAEREGYGPEELQNLISQRMQEIATDISAALGLPYDPEPD